MTEKKLTQTMVPLFPTMVYHVENLVNDEWSEKTKKAMLDIELGTRVEYDAVEIPKTAFFGDEDHTNDYNIDTGWLFKQISKHTREYLKEMSVPENRYNISIQKWWPVVCIKGGHVSRHMHYNSHLSVVYYVDVPDPRDKDPGCLVFYANDDYFPRRIGLASHDRGNIDTFATLVPKTGDMLIFPSNLTHAVTDNAHKNHTRLSISADVMLTRKTKSDGESDEMAVLDPSLWTQI